MHFGISEGKGGLKHGSRPWLGMDIFWNCPINLKNIRVLANLQNVLIHTFHKSTTECCVFF